MSHLSAHSGAVWLRAAAAVALFACTAWTAPAAAAPAGCANGSYLVRDGVLLQLDEHAVRSRVVAELPAQTNALAYEQAQGRFFAIVSEADGSHLAAIDPGGGLTDLGPAPPGTEDAYAGAIRDGRWYLHGRGDLVVLDVDVHGPDYLEVVDRRPLSKTVDVGDWAFGPAGDLLYGIEASGPDPGRLTAVDPATGKVTVAGVADVPGATDYGAVVIDPTGTLHALRNSSGVMYHVPLAEPGTTTSTPLAAPARSVDAAGCPQVWDFGDAPESYGTTLAGDGPRHTISTFTELSIGDAVDAEPDGTPSADADAAIDDDLEVPVDLAIGNLRVDVPVRNLGGDPAVLAGWLDLDGDGRFEATERTTTKVTPGESTRTLHWTRGVTTSDEHGFLRLRLNGDAAIEPEPTGPALGGEVEDHRVRYRWPKSDPTSTTAPAAEQPASPTASPTTTSTTASSATRITSPSSPATTSTTKETVDYVAAPPDPKQPQDSSVLRGPLIVVAGVLVPAVVIAARAVARAVGRTGR